MRIDQSFFVFVLGLLYENKVGAMATHIRREAVADYFCGSQLRDFKTQNQRRCKKQHLDDLARRMS